MDPAEGWCITVLLHAAENTSTEPIDEEGIAVILRGAGGSGSHLRAVFGDGSLQAIAAGAASSDIPFTTVLTAYAAAKDSVAAANSELDLTSWGTAAVYKVDHADLEIGMREEGGAPGLLKFGRPTMNQGRMA